MASASRSLLPVLLALSAAGCLVPPEAPVGHVVLDGIVTPPAEEGPGSHEGQAPRPPSEDECGEMALDAQPRVVRPGEDVVFRALFRNCGAQPLERATPCLGPLWEPRTRVEGVTYHVGEGAAHDGRVCLTAIGHWRLMPGETMEGEWRWNGTFTSCGADCLTWEAPPGVYGFEAALSRKDAMTQAGEGAWNASVRVEVLPRA